MDKSLKIFVGGIAAREEPQEVENYFSTFGPIANCRIKTNRQTGRCLGFGYITCGTRATFEAIIAKKDHCINGRVVECKKMLKKGQLECQVEEERNKKLFIGNLNKEVYNEDLKDYFEQFGATINAYIICKPGSTESKGFGYVIFEELKSANLVLKTKTHILKGQKVMVTKFKNKKEQKNQKTVKKENTKKSKVNKDQDQYYEDSE